MKKLTVLMILSLIAAILLSVVLFGTPGLAETGRGILLAELVAASASTCLISADRLHTAAKRSVSRHTKVSAAA